MEYTGYFFAILIGLVMGIIGGGGSILSVPVFVYFFKMDVVTATTFSLFVVGVTSAFGAIKNAKDGFIDFKTALVFGLPSVFSIIFVRKIVLPNLPQKLIEINNLYVTKDVFILSLFSVLMLLSSIKMITGNHDIEIYHKKPQYPLLITQGIAVGMITGMIGAGGGFLIVPALVMLLNLNIKKAIGTSLFIISINSILGFVSSQNIDQINWQFLLIFSGIAILGMLLGIKISNTIDSKKLKPVFGWFVLIMGLIIIIKEVFFQ